MCLGASRAQALEDKFTSRRLPLLRAGFRRLPSAAAISRGLPAFLPRVLKRIPSRIHHIARDAGRDERAEAFEPPLRARVKRRWRPSRVPRRCAFCTLCLCTAAENQNVACVKNFIARFVYGPAISLDCCRVILVDEPNRENCKARDPAGKRLNRQW
jgi:hypothetical protein